MPVTSAPSRTVLRSVLAVTAAVASGCLVLTLSACAPPVASDPVASTATLPGGYTGDAALAELLRPSFASVDPAPAVAAAVIEADGTVRTVFHGADESSVFEIGSITKTFTGELVAEAIARGEVELDDTLDEHLDLAGTPVGELAIADLVTHSSGLPTFPDHDEAWLDRLRAAYEAGQDGIDETLDELLAEARSVPATSIAPERQYSNLGAALVGQALAAAAGTDYPTLLEDRLFGPLGLDDASLPLVDSEVPTGHLGGAGEAGDPAEPTTLAAYAPAGGIHATLGDLVAYAEAVIDGPLTGSAAQQAHGEVTDTGYFWGLQQVGDHAVVEHGGMTNGFSSMLFIDTTAGTASIVLVNRNLGLEGVAETLIAATGR